MKTVALCFSRYLDPFHFPPSPLSNTNAHFCYVWMWRCSLCLSKLFSSLSPTKSCRFGEWLSVTIGCLTTTLSKLFNLYAELQMTLIKALACMKYELLDFGPEECNANSVSVPQTALLSTLLMFSCDASVLCSKWTLCPNFLWNRVRFCHFDWHSVS